MWPLRRRALIFVCLSVFGKNILTKMSKIISLSVIISINVNSYSKILSLNHFSIMDLRAFLCLFVAASLAIAAPRISHYAGTGYNLLKGNPLTYRVDPGFTNQIFYFTYNNQVTTNDGRYLIPDNVSYLDVTSCVFTSSVQTYRGTKNYQNELSAKA